MPSSLPNHMEFGRTLRTDVVDGRGKGPYGRVSLSLPDRSWTLWSELFVYHRTVWTLHLQGLDCVFFGSVVTS